MNAHVEAFFDPATFTYSYVVSDPVTQQCAVIDSVLDYDPASGRTSHATAQRLVDYVRAQGLTVQWLLETHVHADHLSAAPYLKQQLGGRLAIGDRITVVQDTFGKLFNAGSEFATDGRQFDHLFHDGDTFQVGNIQAHSIHTPGHTPACMTYVIGDAAFVGDTLFMPDYGTARCDFPGGDARTLYQSIQKLFTLPDSTRVFMCHDYKAPGREEFLYETTIAAERELNVHVHAGITEEEFVAMRTARDATLGMPTLILPSVQINMRGGELPEPESNGTRYLKIPLDVL
ncbi:MAG: MBL fold metallo-hydrolase [Gammaproteobacteria bacterium HGW-Gammaproteobacteria-9]|uniref:MBL fold metallo-hydrolase n=1 Tax=Pseudomonas sp. (strain SCT) TaxID=412955 RepID=UPI000CBDECC2|nr:MBL fold metallo-hydrolase [Pseudomonas sp. SCT]PKM00914.1 MAG: MBL fold metallo-hydrolase [Gammaproteobacteria bacterium HGW-Gammaproteobacteria-9]GCA55467.1 putative metallo-hydrolase [Pseudomonas sp. SCT]